MSDDREQNTNIPKKIQVGKINRLNLLITYFKYPPSINVFSSFIDKV